MTVWIVSYDWGSYGSGISGVFSSKEKALAFIASKENSFGTYSYEEITVDAELKYVAGSYET